MSNELAKKSAVELDGFAGYTDEYEGDEQFSDRIIIGEHVKYTNDSKWVLKSDPNNTDIIGRELVASSVARVVQKWSPENLPLERITLGPGEKFPDVKAMNEKCPQSEWRIGPSGKLEGPWQAQHILYLADLDKAERYTYPTATVGGHRAITDLIGKIDWMRRFRGSTVYPVVKLSKTFMPTKFGGRMRPEFPIVRWIRRVSRRS
jgi:hypothetical protein